MSIDLYHVYTGAGQLQEPGELQTADDDESGACQEASPGDQDVDN